MSESLDGDIFNPLIDGDVTNKVNLSKKSKFPSEHVQVHGHCLQHSLGVTMPLSLCVNSPQEIEITDYRSPTKSTGNVIPGRHHRNRSLDSAIQQIPVHIATVSSVTSYPIAQTALSNLSPFVSGHRRVGSLGVAFRDNSPYSSISTSCCNDPILSVSVSTYSSLSPCQKPPAPHCGNSNSVHSHAKNGHDQISMGSDDSGICNSDDSYKLDRTSEPCHMNDSQHHHQESLACSQELESLQPSITEMEVEGEPLAKSVTTVVIPLKKSTCHSVLNNGHIQPPKESLLLRLFESKMFDMSIAITHLFNSKEHGVQIYIEDVSSTLKNNLEKVVLLYCAQNSQIPTWALSENSKVETSSSRILEVAGSIPVDRLSQL